MFRTNNVRTKTKLLRIRVEQRAITDAKSLRAFIGFQDVRAFPCCLFVRPMKMNLDQDKGTGLIIESEAA